METKCLKMASPLAKLLLVHLGLHKVIIKNPKREINSGKEAILHTGDVALMEENNYIRITDRIKDVIKTGGEWVSSIELEGLISGLDQYLKLRL